MKRPSELLLESAGPFDEGCMKVKEMESVLEELRSCIRNDCSNGYMLDLIDSVLGDETALPPNR